MVKGSGWRGLCGEGMGMLDMEVGRFLELGYGFEKESRYLGGKVLFVNFICFWGFLGYSIFEV